MNSGLTEAFAHWSANAATLYRGIVARGPRVVDDANGVNRMTRTVTITLSPRASDGIPSIEAGNMVTLWDNRYATGSDALLTSASKPAGATDYRVDQVDYVNDMIRVAATAVPRRDLASFHRGR